MIHFRDQQSAIRHAKTKLVPGSAPVVVGVHTLTGLSVWRADWMANNIAWWQAAEIIGISDRQMRRWRERDEEFVVPGLV